VDRRVSMNFLRGCFWPFVTLEMIEGSVGSMWEQRNGTRSRNGAQKNEGRVNVRGEGSAGYGTRGLKEGVKERRTRKGETKQISVLNMGGERWGKGASNQRADERSGRIKRGDRSFPAGGRDSGGS